MRTKKSFYNVVITAIYYMVITIIGLFLRKIFLECLGIGYIGLDTVFANILSLLGLVELGVGPAITYRLYKPLAEGNEKEIILLMAVYKKFYNCIAMAVSILGIILACFLPIIVKEAPVQGGSLIVCYILYLLATIASYHLANKRSLLVADQQQYTTMIVDIVFNVVVFGLKVVVLKVTRSYILVLVINILRVVVSNIVISKICDKEYPFLRIKRDFQKKEIGQKAQDMVLDIKYIMLHKFCNYVYSSTDGIVISSFMGVSSVGLLANYNMIVNVVSNMFMQCSSSIQASIGNLINSVDSDKNTVKINLRRLSYIYYSILSFFTISLFCLLSPFIALWIGEEYVISMSIVLVICINMYIYSFYQPIANMYTVLGLFKGDKVTSPIAAVVNLLISILTVKYYGLIGVYIGTILGSCIYIFGRTYIVYKKYFDENPIGYYKLIFKYMSITLIEGSVTWIVVQLIGEGVIQFVIKMVVCILVPNVMNYLLFKNSEEFSYCKNLLCKLIRRR